MNLLFKIESVVRVKDIKEHIKEPLGFGERELKKGC